MTRTLERLQELKKEFLHSPEVVVVWAQPELSRLYLFDQLLQREFIHHVLGRPALEGENQTKATTYAESHNIRLGLEFIKNTYSDAYVVIQTADVIPRPGTYSFVDKHFQQGSKAVLFHWANGVAREHIWHTNFCGVCLDEKYWPPISPNGHLDVLERQWGVQLQERQLPDVKKWHNYQQKLFIHSHDSENLPDFPRRGLLSHNTIPCLISGYRRWYDRMWRSLKRLVGVLFFIRSLKNGQS